MQANNSTKSGGGLVAAVAIILAVFFVLFTGYFTLLKPNILKISAQKAENSKLTFLLSLYDKESSLIKKLEKLEPLSGSSSKPENARAAEVLGRLAAIAEKSKLQLDHFEVLSEDRLQNVFNRVTLQVIVSGKYGDQLSFLNTMFRLPLLLDVSKYELTMTAPSTAEEGMHAQIQLEIFYLDRAQHKLKAAVKGSHI